MLHLKRKNPNKKKEHIKRSKIKNKKDKKSRKRLNLT